MRFATASEVSNFWLTHWKYQTLANDINRDRTSTEYVGITADAICRQRPNVHWICRYHCRCHLPPKTERPLNVSVSLPMPFAAKAHRAEEQFGRVKSTLNKLKSLKFRLGTRRPADSRSVGHYFELLKTFFKNGTARRRQQQQQQQQQQ